MNVGDPYAPVVGPAGIGASVEVPCCCGILATLPLVLGTCMQRLSRHVGRTAELRCDAKSRSVLTHGYPAVGWFVWTCGGCNRYVVVEVQTVMMSNRVCCYCSTFNQPTAILLFCALTR